MSNRRNTTAEQDRLERAFEAIASGEEGYELVFHPATGQLVAVDDVGDEDRLPATQMAREGFFCGRQPAACDISPALGQRCLAPGQGPPTDHRAEEYGRGVASPDAGQPNQR